MSDTQTPDAPLNGEALLDSLVDVPSGQPVPEIVAPIEGTPPIEPPPPEIEPSEEESDKELEDAQTKADAENAPNNLDLRSSRGKTIYGHHKAVRAITQALGFEPTPEDIQAWHTSHIDHDSMLADLQSATPANITNFVRNMANVAPDGVAALAAVLPNWLAQNSVTPDGQYNQAAIQMYSRMATPILMRTMQGMYADAASAADPVLKRSLEHAAQTIEWRLTGKFRPVAQPGQPAPAAQPDPYAAERSRLDQDKREIAQWRQSQSQSRTQQFTESTNAVIHSAVMTKLEEAMAPVKSTETPELYEILRDRFHSEVMTNIQRNAPDRYREYCNAYERAERAPSQEASAALARLYASMATREIQSLRAKYLKLATNGRAAASAQTHADLARAASQVSPATGSNATSRIIPKVPDGATSEDIRKSKLDQLLG